MNRNVVNTQLEKSFDRGFAIGLLSSGLSLRGVSHRVNVPKSTLQEWLRLYRAGQKVPHRSPGRPHKTTIRSDRLLVILARRHHLSSARELLQVWRERVCIHTVYRRLRARGLKKFRRPVCPLKTRAQRQIRLRWCMTRVIWRQVWSRIVFTDESRFKKIGNDGRVMVWRKRGERFIDRNVADRVQGGGGSVHIWGAIWVGGRSRLHVLMQSVNQFTYAATLQSFVNESAADLPVNFILQDDNATPHRAHSVNLYKTEAGIQSLPWPAVSPDLNPIEHVWHYVSRKINAKEVAANSLAQLAQWVVQEWNAMPQQYVDNLIHSMPRRVDAVIRANGGHTRY